MSAADRNLMTGCEVISSIKEETMSSHFTSQEWVNYEGKFRNTEVWKHVCNYLLLTLLLKLYIYIYIYTHTCTHIHTGGNK